jgi:hypothetical protein
MPSTLNSDASYKIVDEYTLQHTAQIRTPLSPWPVCKKLSKPLIRLKAEMWLILEEAKAMKSTYNQMTYKKTSS